MGDAFARPLIDEIEQTTYDLSSLLAVVSGGAALSAGVKSRLLELMPSIIIMDGLGASETGQQGRQTLVKGQGTSTGDFDPVEGMRILSEDLTEVLPSGHDGMGWLAQAGRVPIGYLGDADKSARTFPVIDGVRYSVPGDRARLTADGSTRAVRPRLGRRSTRAARRSSPRRSRRRSWPIPRSWTASWPAGPPSVGATR